MSWPPVIQGLRCDADPEVYWIAVKYHELPEHLRARAVFERSGLDLQNAFSNYEDSANTTVSGTSDGEVPANAPTNSPFLGQVQQSTVAPITFDRDASADILGVGPQQWALGPGTQDDEQAGTLDQPSVYPVIVGDRELEDDCRKNPNMQLFIQRHPSPTMQNKAIRRDMIARRTLGEFYQQHNQDSYNVIEKRANMTQDLKARAQELDGGFQSLPPASNKDGNKHRKTYCRICQAWFFDFKVNHVKRKHMQDPDNDKDMLLICPDNLLGLRLQTRQEKFEEIVSAHFRGEPYRFANSGRP